MSVLRSPLSLSLSRRERLVWRKRKIPLRAETLPCHLFFSSLSLSLSLHAFVKSDVAKDSEKIFSCYPAPDGNNLHNATTNDYRTLRSLTSISNVLDVMSRLHPKFGVGYDTTRFTSSLADDFIDLAACVRFRMPATAPCWGSVPSTSTRYCYVAQILRIVRVL
jgi:hypothetical protein